MLRIALIAGIGALLGGILLLTAIVTPLAAVAVQNGAGAPGSGAQPPGCVTCLNPSGNALAAAALSISSHLVMCQQPGDTYLFDKCYPTPMPDGAVRYWASICPPGSGCWPWWQSGSFQCVTLLTGAFALVGDPLPVAPDAILFWSAYAGRAGWTEIPVNLAWDATGAPRGLPAPGDMVVWYEGNSPGHIALVTDVTPPANGQAGSLTYTQANGPAPVDHAVILPDLSVPSSSGSTLVGYIRRTP